MPPAARLGDMHTCPMVNPGPVPHVGGPILPPCCPTVLTGVQPQARVTDMAFCTGPPDVIAKGSTTVLVGFLMAARIGDPTIHGGVIVQGLPTVMIGDAGGGGGGGGVGGAAGGGAGGAGGAGGGAGGTALPPGATLVGYMNGMPIVRMPDGSIRVGNAIVIRGSPEFQSQTLAALGEIAGTPTGSGLLASLDSSGQTVTIRESTGGNGASPVDGSRAVPNADGTPGPGTGTNVSYNPNRTQIGDGSQPWHTRPPAVGLAHELMHANHSAHGTNDFTQRGEDMVVGNPPHDSQPFTENRIRSEWNPPQPPRTEY